MQGDINKLFVFKSLLTTLSNVLPSHFKQTFSSIIRQNIAGWYQQTFCFQKLVDNAQQCFALHLKQTFPPIIWIFTKGEGHGIKFRLPFKIFSTLSTTLLLAPQDFQSFLWPWVQKADSSRWWYTYCQLFRRRVVFEATRCFYFCCLSYFGFHYNFQSDLVRHTLIYANKRSFPFFSIWILLQFTLSTKNLIIILSLVKHYEFFIKTINRRVKNNKCLDHHSTILPYHKLTRVIYLSKPNYFKKQSSSSSFLLT